MKKLRWMPPQKKYANPEIFSAPQHLNKPPILPHFFSMLTGCAAAIDRYNVQLVGGHYTLRLNSDYSTEPMKSYVDYNEPFPGPLYPPSINYPIWPISDPTNDQVLHYDFQNRSWKLYKNVPNVGVSFIKIVLGREGIEQKCFPYMVVVKNFFFYKKKGI